MAAAGQSSVDTDSWCSTRTVEETRGRAAAFAVASRQYRASRVALPAPATGADAYGGSLLRRLSSGFGLGRRSASERDGSLAAAVAAEAQQHASGAQLLEARLARLGFGLAVMKDDGNCQFRALSHQLFGTQAHHKEVRAEAVAHIRANEEVFAPFFTGGEMVRYLAAMGRDRTWGDELTLRAVCDSFGVVLYIVQSTQENWLLTYEPEERSSKRRSSKRLFLTYLSPVHYNAITLPDGS